MVLVARHRISDFHRRGDRCDGKPLLHGCVHGFLGGLPGVYVQQCVLGVFALGGFVIVVFEVGKAGADYR